jgi:hypothetical protein
VAWKNLTEDVRQEFASYVGPSWQAQAEARWLLDRERLRRKARRKWVRIKADLERLRRRRLMANSRYNADRRRATWLQLQTNPDMRARMKEQSRLRSARYRSKRAS